MIDASAFVGAWPFRRLPWTEPEALEARLRQEGIVRALATPLEGLLHLDPQPANAHWGERLKEHPFFGFVPLLNPTLRGWERSLAACQARWGAVAARLTPGYHGYAADDSAADEAARAAADAGLPLIVQLRMQDRRAMHPQLQFPDVDPRAAAELAARVPEATLVLSGCFYGEADALLARSAERPNLYLTTTHIEAVDALALLAARYGTERLLFGTHAPLFTPTAARLKGESVALADADRQRLVAGNATRLFR